MSSIFLSHNHGDKDFARRLAKDLRRAGARVWIDEAEIKIGDSLIEKIRSGIDEMEYVAVILSHSSIKSRWVEREVDIAMNQEIEGKKVKVLPLLIEDCQLPWFLEGKLYADFRRTDNYDSEFGKLLDRLGIEREALPLDPRSLFTLLSGGIARSDADIIRRALVGFLSLGDGHNDGLVRDVLGSIGGWHERSQLKNNDNLDVTAQAILGGLSEEGAPALAAIHYLKHMGDYFSPYVPRAIAEGVSSTSKAERIGSNLCFYGYENLYGNTDDAETSLLDRAEPLPLRVAAAWTLGLARHVNANRALCDVAARLEGEDELLQAAVLEGLCTLSKRAAAGQTKDGFIGIMDTSSVEAIRKEAAKRYLEIASDEKFDRYRDDLRQKYTAAVDKARLLLTK